MRVCACVRVRVCVRARVCACECVCVCVCMCITGGMKGWKAIKWLVEEKAGKS